MYVVFCDQNYIFHLTIEQSIMHLICGVRFLVMV